LKKGDAVKNFGILLIILAVIRLWVEAKVKTATATTPVNPTMVKLDMPILGTNITTTYLLLGAGLFLFFRPKL
jgi:cytochrome b561